MKMPKSKSKNNQLTIDDEFRRIRNPELTRAERIELYEEMGKQRMAEAEFWQKHGQTYRAMHFRQVAQGDFSLAAMLRR